ncbi:hypothetical protein [Clostridium perfringens]|uniref:Uncharacterized protein n=1 Tax=Clostridium perfringens E str. JGS1987 TaxID=451755 RepID=B1BVL3_CLOPF|nr:hypothetical protein [Clostridium perfringens]EDT14261.1 hypothetical protein AC3_A0292 [Clostridium perfringens E str. JGS1987]
MRTTMGEAYEILNKALLERISSLDSEKDSVIVCDPKGEKIASELKEKGYNLKVINIIEYNDLKFISNIMEKDKELAKCLCYSWTRNILVDYLEEFTTEVIDYVSKVLYRYIEKINIKMERKFLANRNDFKEYLTTYVELIEGDDFIRALKIVISKIHSVPLAIEFPLFDDIKNIVDDNLENIYKSLFIKGYLKKPVALDIIYGDKCYQHEEFLNIILEHIIIKIILDRLEECNLNDINLLLGNVDNKYFTLFLKNLDYYFDYFEKKEDKFTNLNMQENNNINFMVFNFE